MDCCRSSFPVKSGSLEVWKFGSIACRSRDSAADHQACGRMMADGLYHITPSRRVDQTDMTITENDLKTGAPNKATAVLDMVHAM
jgi:hypothetical protein